MTETVRVRAADRPSWGRRLAGIEGLRGLAALTVVFGHVQVHLAREVSLGPAEPIASVLHHGLTLFFALSGFLLFRPFAAAILGGSRPPSARRFLTNRALRIYPAYVVILLLSSFVLQTTYTQAGDDSSGVAGVRNTLGPMTEPGTLLLDLTLFHTLFPSSIKTGLGASWSLTAELCFYLLLPLLAGASLALARRGVPRLLAVAVVPATLLVVGFAGKLASARTLVCDDQASCFAQQWGGTWHAVLERSILAQADLFSYGAAAVLFVLAERRSLSDTATQVLRWACTAVVVAVGAVLLARGHLPGPFERVRWENTTIAAVCACLILATTLPAAGHRTSLLGRVLELAPLRWSGLISYSLYLWHLPVLWWLEVHGFAFPATRTGFLGNLVLVVGATALLATITYRFVEAPALRMKKRTDTPALVAVNSPVEVPVPPAPPEPTTPPLAGGNAGR